MYRSDSKLRSFIDREFSASNASNSTVFISTDINIDNAELINSYENNNGNCRKPPSYFYGIIGCCIGFVGLLCGLYFGLGFNKAPIQTTTTTVLPTTVPIMLQLTIGQACINSSQCIPTSYCDSTTSVCSCSPALYYDSKTGTCNVRKSYGESCSSSNECELNELLTCLNSVCKCDTMLFYNSNTNMCEDKRGLAESCIGASNECYSSKMVCTSVSGSVSNRCICPLTTMYFSFFTGDCEFRKGHGTQCYAHFECVDYAWCTTWPSDSTSRCTCIPSHYWSGSACLEKKNYLASCSYDYECIDTVLSLQCISNKCDCSSDSVWNGTACNFLKPIGGPCSSSTDCLFSGSICQYIAEQSQYLCVCPIGTYFSLTSSSCSPFKNLGQVCKDTTECTNNATCLWQSSTSDMRCQCTLSTYYQYDSTTCLFLKYLNEPCSSSIECKTNLGLTCLSGTCQCDTNNYWSGTECLIKKTYNSYTYNQYCYSSSECKSSLGLNNCVIGKCVCDYPKTWSSGSLMCV